MKDLVQQAVSLGIGLVSFAVYLIAAFIGAVITIVLIGGLYNLIF